MDCTTKPTWKDALLAGHDQEAILRYLTRWFGARWQYWAPASEVEGHVLTKAQSATTWMKLDPSNATPTRRCVYGTVQLIGQWRRHLSHVRFGRPKNAAISNDAAKWLVTEAHAEEVIMEAKERHAIWRKAGTAVLQGQADAKARLVQAMREYDPFVTVEEMQEVLTPGGSDPGSPPSKATIYRWLKRFGGNEESKT